MSLNLNKYLNGIFERIIPNEGFSREVQEDGKYFDFLENLREKILNGEGKNFLEDLEIFAKFSDNDKKIVKYIFFSDKTKLISLGQIDKILNEKEKISHENSGKILSIVQSEIYNKFSVIGKLLGIKKIDSEKLSIIGENNFLSGDIISSVKKFQKNIFEVTKYFGEKIIEKDEKIQDLTSKNNYLNEENIILDDKNFDLMEKKFFLEEENASLEEKISLGEEKILELKKSKENIEKSRKKILKEKEELERVISELESKNGLFSRFNIFKNQKIDSLREDLKGKNDEIKRLNLTIQNNNAKLLSFQNQVKDLELKNYELEKDLEFEKSENERLREENGDLENQIRIFSKTLKYVLENKRKKEKELNSRIEKNQSLKDRMRNKLKK